MPARKPPPEIRVTAVGPDGQPLPADWGRRPEVARVFGRLYRAGLDAIEATDLADSALPVEA